LNPYNFFTATHVKTLKTGFNTVKTKYQTSTVLVDLTMGFRIYSSQKCVRKFKF